MTAYPRTRAAGRSNAAMVLSVFGACWLLVSCAYFNRLNGWIVSAIALIALTYFVTAVRLRKEAKSLPADSLTQDEKKRNDRSFGILNGITWTAIGILFLALPRFNLSNYVFPSVVAVVGLHFLPMPPLYRNRANRITGIAMVLCAIACAILLRADGARMAAAVTLCAGLILWVSAASALQTASSLVRNARA